MLILEYFGTTKVHHIHPSSPDCWLQLVIAAFSSLFLDIITPFNGHYLCYLSKITTLTAVYIQPYTSYVEIWEVCALALLLCGFQIPIPFSVKTQSDHRDVFLGGVHLLDS